MRRAATVVAVPAGATSHRWLNTHKKPLGVAGPCPVASPRPASGSQSVAARRGIIAAAMTMTTDIAAMATKTRCTAEASVVGSG